MVRIGPMTSGIFAPDRRKLLAGLGALALVPAGAAAGVAQGRRTIAIQARPDTLVLRPGGAPTPVWSLTAPELTFKRGETAEVAFDSRLPAPAVLNWRGLDGVAAAEPLLGRPAGPAGARETFPLPLRHAGTMFCDPALLGDGHAAPARGLAVVVQESEPVPVDRDVVLLIEEWRLKPDGTALAPGVEPNETTKETAAVYTVNGQTSLELAARPNERLRLRVINGCQRAVIAVKIEGAELRVMATDGQPAEPFAARNGALVLAPGGRADAFLDVAAGSQTPLPILLHDGKDARPLGRLAVSGGPPIRPAPLPPAPPLPSNGLPARLDLKNALRVELPLGGPQPEWVRPADFTASAGPAFRARAGRTVVLALTNRAPSATTFHLHGHHFRLLDRLDDGWKPFWLDTLALEAGQTQRIAFAAEHTGRFLIEAVALDWAQPRRLRWYSVE